MIIVKGNLLSVMHDYNYIGFTANGIVSAKNKLVMGKGFAKDIKNINPGIDERLGSILKHRKRRFAMYGILFDTETNVFAFQTKDHWREPSFLSIINESTMRLKYIAESFTNKTFALNYPGISFGRLTEKDVYPIIKVLPDNVYVYKLN